LASDIAQLNITQDIVGVADTILKEVMRQATLASAVVKISIAFLNVALCA